MSWHHAPLMGFDVETTGTDPETDRIVTAALVTIGDDDEARESWLINPGIDIPAGAVGVHGITTARAKAEGADAADALDEISACIADMVTTYGLPIVAMNARFDLTMLDRELRRHGQRTLVDRLGEIAPVIDPQVLDKRADRYRRGGRTLTDLCRTYGVTLDAAHEATADAVAAVNVARAIAEQYPVVQGDAMAVHSQQVKWAGQQARSLAAYFARTPGKESRAASVFLDWPLIPHQRGEA